MMGCNFAPLNWAFCDGSLLSISQNTALFSLLGTTYGGNGVSTFALPNLLGRTPVHQGAGPGGTYVIGQLAGEENVTLTLSQIPAHSHVPEAVTGGGGGNPANSPANNFWSGWTGGQFSSAVPNSSMNSAAVGIAGGSQPHDNMPPFQVINFVIALVGIFPSQG